MKLLDRAERGVQEIRATLSAGVVIASVALAVAVAALIVSVARR